MDTYDPFIFESATVEKQTESSAFSDTSSGTSGIKRVTESDEDLKLASNTPKKRTGRRIFKETRHPVYRGVRGRNKNKWVCELREPNKKTRIWLGTYPTPEMAARAHDVAALALRGKLACLNFADSAWLLPRPSSTDSKDIIKAATEAAESFRPPEFGGVFDGINDKVLANNDENEEEAFDENEEEEAFDETDWLSKLAQGPLFSPPHYPTSDMDWDSAAETEVDCSLWSFSI